MICNDVIQVLEELSPKSFALDWDNVGLLVGRRDKVVNKILIALDATDKVVDYAVKENVDMIVTHHPMIFSKIKRVTADDVLGSKILKLAGHDISYFAMHTNFDVKGGMSQLAAEKIGLSDMKIFENTTDTEGIGRVGKIDGADKAADLIDIVKKAFDIEHVFVYGELDRAAEKIAISPGSGRSMVDLAIKEKIDVLITGDIGHHEGLDGVEAGLTIIDATHFGIEHIFIEFIYNYLTEKCKGTELVKLDMGCPVKVY